MVGEIRLSSISARIDDKRSVAMEKRKQQGTRSSENIFSLFLVLE
jgi:hypothetical protein